MTIPRPMRKPSPSYRTRLIGDIVAITNSTVFNNKRL